MARHLAFHPELQLPLPDDPAVLASELRKAARAAGKLLEVKVRTMAAPRGGLFFVMVVDPFAGASGRCRARCTDRDVGDAAPRRHSGRCGWCVGKMSRTRADQIPRGFSAFDRRRRGLVASSRGRGCVARQRKPSEEICLIVPGACQGEPRRLVAASGRGALWSSEVLGAGLRRAPCRPAAGSRRGTASERSDSSLTPS